MPKNTKSIALKALLITLTAGLISLFASTAYGYYDTSITFPTCSLGIYPYNPTGTVVGPLDAQWFNLFEGNNNSTCTAHLQYPNQYTPQPPLVNQNPLASTAGVGDKKAPEARHNHIYHNASREDTFYYKTFMDRFQVILEQDALINTDKYNLVCYTPKNGGGFIETPGCNGSIPSEWGGTNISYNPSTGVITWKYATSGSGRPMMWGKNPSIGTSNGLIQASVKLISKNNPQDIWSGTTTSRVLIRDLATLKNTGDPLNSPSCTNDGTSSSNYDYDGNWCTLPAPNYSGVEGTLNDSSTGNKTYYWYRIGVVGTVWRKPPPVEACDSIDISPTGPFVETELPKTINITPHTTGGLTLDYKWTADNSGGFISFDNVAYNGSPYFETSTSTILNKLKALTGPVTVTVTAVKKSDHSKVYTGGCQKQITITKTPGPACNSLQFTDADSQDGILDAVSGQTFTHTFTISSDPASGLQYRWTTSSASGKFDTTHNSPYTTSAKQVTYTDTNPIDGTTITVTAVDANGNAVNTTLCQKSVKLKVTPPPEGQCLNLNPSISKQPINPGDTVTLGGAPTYSYPATPQQIRWSETGNGYFTNVPGSPATCTTPATAAVNAAHSANTEILAPYTCSYYYTAATAGDTVSMEARPNTPINSNCLTTYTVTTETQNAECSYLTLDPQELYENDQDTDLTAHAYFTYGGPYNIKVKWEATNGDLDLYEKTDSSNNNFINTFQPNNNDNQSSVSVWVDQILSPNVGIGNCAAKITRYTPPEQDKCHKIHVYENSDGESCVDVTQGKYNGKFTWVFDGDKQSPTWSCVTIPSDTSWEVYATDEPNNNDCKASGYSEKRPPRVSKSVRPAGKGSYIQVISIPSNQEQVDYRIQFDTDSNSPTSAIITDDISNGSIDGITMPGNNGSTGHIDYVSGSQSVERPNGSKVPVCHDNEDENCYTGDIGHGGIRLVKVTGTVIIFYRGQINETAITADICKLGTVCQEKYTNSAKVEYWFTDSDDNETDHKFTTSKDALVQIFCQYILTRAAGDIYLETDLNAGVDIRMCSKYTSTTGIIITPGQPKQPDIVSTGQSTIMSLNHEICTAGQSGLIPEALKSFYGQTVSELSSQICEVKLQPGTAWQQKTITNDIAENKTRISRWEPDYSGMNVNMSSVKLDSQYADKKVYHVKDGNLTIDQQYLLSDGEGAKTIIVENGDLYINDNISYGTCLADKQPCTVNDIASLAFIVLNGSIYVDPSVTEMSGVYFVQEGDRADSGRLYSLNNEPSYNQLIVYGSVYGDIEPLFLNRLFAGDPTLEEAGIVVRFDERIILNTPPGLRDVISYSSTEVAR
jgi:hypothetical protein